MATAFTRTLRSLAADRFRNSAVALLAGFVLVSAWGYWACASRVTLYEITETARLEVVSAIYPLQSPIDGRVTASTLEVGREVHEGDVLVELDVEPQLRRIEELRSQIAALRAERTSSDQQIAAEHRAIDQEALATVAATEEVRANRKEAQAPARYAQDDVERLAKLRDSGLIAERDYQKSKSEAERAHAGIDVYETTIRKIEQEQRTKSSDRAAKIQLYKSGVTKMDGQMKTLTSSIATLEYEVERRRVRAPVSGRLGEVAMLRIGTFIDVGDKLGAIVPSGTLAIIAQFPPQAAFGRIRTGQLARMRVAGFPWAQFGTVPAEVTRVAGEVRDGNVRVELVVPASAKTSIPLQHGLPGSIEVEVETISPFQLFLRNAGRLVSEPRPTFPQRTVGGI